MGFYLNKVFLGGNLTQDPEVKTLANGSKVCNFTIAVTRVWYSEYNNPETKNEETSFIRITAWNRLAEKMNDVTKGANIFVEGRLSQNKYQAQDGTQKSYIDVVADRISFITKHGKSFNEQMEENHSESRKEEYSNNQNNSNLNEKKEEENTDDLWSNEQ